MVQGDSSRNKEIVLADPPSGSEEDLPRPQRKRARKSKKSDAPRSSTSKAKSKPKPMTLNRKMQRLKEIKIEPTRWVDKQVLEDLGIYGEVKSIFDNMGLGCLFDMEELAHVEETRQFLASLKLFDDPELDLDEENRGCLEFTIHGTDYAITVAQLGMLFHLPPGGETFIMHFDDVEAQGVWSMIADGGNFDKGRSKGSSIRHPAIRYAHKILASTLFARREPGNVIMEELLWLIEGLKPHLVTIPNGDAIIGQPERVNLSHYFARRFHYYIDWAMNTKDTTPELAIGGLITPILRACGVPIKKPREEPVIANHDAPHLATTKFLVGRLQNRYCYKFKLNGAYKTIALPNPQCTSFEERARIFFKPSSAHLYNPSRDGKLQSVRSHPSLPREEEDEVEAPPPVYGSKRYDFEPYGGPVMGDALRAAHERIDLLQRLVKWQGKQLKNVVTTMKKQGKKIKELLSRLSPSQSSSSSSSREVARRSKGKAPLSPSTSGSGNYDYALESSSHSSPEF